MGKGDRPRPVDLDKYVRNYERIFEDDRSVEPCRARPAPKQDRCIKELDHAGDHFNGFYSWTNLEDR